VVRNAILKNVFCCGLTEDRHVDFFLRQVFQGSLHFNDLNIYIYDYHTFQLSTETAKVWLLLYNYMLVTSKCRRWFSMWHHPLRLLFTK